MRTTHSILIIGGGNMGAALARGWHAGGHDVTVVEPDTTKHNTLAALGVDVTSALPSKASDIIVLAIKPQQFAENKSALIKLCHNQPLLLSIMAGVAWAPLADISPRAVRVMPNLPATLCESMSVLFANNLSLGDRQLSELLFSAVGKTAWVEEESQLHAVTAISGSGPAYLFRLMEALQHAATTHGLDPKLAASLITQTMRGAALLAEQSSLDAATLRRQVTSKGGTTEAALNVLDKNNMDALIDEMIRAAIDRSKALNP